jgi:hypothetical protein
MGSRLRSKLTYANVTASLALFIALGGTSYAATQLQRNSVGAAQIRAKAVGNSELRSSAVTSSKIRNNSISTRDINRSTRASLRGQTGPPGPQGPGGPTAAEYRAVVSTGGYTGIGNATSGGHESGSNQYTLTFGRDVSRCIYTATLAAVQNGPNLEQPEAGRITVAAQPGQANQVLVRTFGADGAAKEQPFHLAVTC